LHEFNSPCPQPKTRSYDATAKYHNTHAWHKKAEQIKKDSKYLCPLCLEEGRAVYSDLETHHIIKLKDAPDRLLDNYNLIPLCVQHHKQADAGEIDLDRLLELARKREEGEI
jgi:5-methylcytosine-specific restriction endonuclease McrA